MPDFPDKSSKENVNSGHIKGGENVIQGNQNHITHNYYSSENNPNFKTNDRNSKIRRPNKYGIQDEKLASTPLQIAIRNLKLNDPIVGNLHRVNCDRYKQTDIFFDFFYENEKRPYHFYLVLANELHQPSSFAERLIYELDERMEGVGQSIYFKTDYIGIKRNIVELRVRNKARQDFKVGFSQNVASENQEKRIFNNVEEFIQTDSPLLRHKYIAQIFEFSDVEYYKDFRTYIPWIIDNFCKIEKSPTTFLFFFVMRFSSRTFNWKRKQIEKELLSLTYKHFSLCILKNFSTVRIEDIKKWFRQFTSNQYEIDQIIKTIINSLDKKDRKKYYDKRRKTFQMSYIQNILNDVCDIHRGYSK